MNYRVKDLTGQVFNGMTVLSYSHSHNNRAYWNYRCFCGYEGKIQSGNLKRQKSCGCARKQSDYIPNSIIPRKLWSNIKTAARKRDIEFKLSVKQAEHFFDGYCALSGEEISLSWEDAWSSCTASLDRIDSKRGYTKDNIQWTHKRVNVMKGDLTNDEFKEWCMLVYYNNN